MTIFGALYPTLEERKPIPSLYLPFTFLLTLVPFLFPDQRWVPKLILPILVSLCLASPFYTFGDPSADYYQSSAFVAMPVWFVEFAIVRSRDGYDAPLFVGSQGQSKITRPKGIKDCQGTQEKVLWAFALMFPSHRGIGWNWQIKNVPYNPYQHLTKWKFVKLHVRKAVFAYTCSATMLVLLGLTSALQDRNFQYSFASRAVDAAIGWAGAIWIWGRLSSSYSFLAASSVAFGICESWQWPPLMGNLKDAWSVRRVWGRVYHQTMRQIVYQPAHRIVSSVGLRNDSLASGCSQIFVSFAISCLLHRFQMFNVTRSDMGELRFFMSQPLAMCGEGLVQWLWRHLLTRLGTRSHTSSTTSFGYLWVFLWFSISLPIYIKGCRDAGIIGDAIFGTTPFDLGASLAKPLIAIQV